MNENAPVSPQEAQHAEKGRIPMYPVRCLEIGESVAARLEIDEQGWRIIPPAWIAMPLAEEVYIDSTADPEILLLTRVK